MPVISASTAQILGQWLQDTDGNPPLVHTGRLDQLVSILALNLKERPGMSIEEASVRLDTFYEVLKDVPLIDVERGCLDLLKTCTFMVVPAELRAAAMKHFHRRGWRRAKARALLEKYRTKRRAHVPKAERPDPADVDALIARLEGKFPSQREEAR